MKNKADQARQLMAEGKSLKEVAAMLGVTLQYLYSLRYVDKKRSTIPVLKKKKATKTRALKQKAALEDHISAQQAVLQQKVWLVPKPKLSWAQRFKVLFTGVV